MRIFALLNPLNWSITEAALEWWDERAAREKLMLLFMTVAVVAMIFFLGNTFMSSSLKTAKQKRDNAMSSKGQVEAIYAEYQARNAESTAWREVMVEHKDFSLAGFLERTANELELSENMSSLNPRGVEAGEQYAIEKVDARFSKIALGDMVDLMHRIEAEAAPMKITNLRVKANTRERSELTVNMTVSMPRLADAPGGGE